MGYLQGIKSSLPFSPAARAADFIFLSGLASVDENNRIIADTFEEETRRTYQNISRVLASGGLTF